MRDCGECQMCCWIYCIPEMGKLGRTDCKHQCAKGCAIHDQPRPSMCTDFVCCWAQLDWWPEELRPDKCHVVFTQLHRDRDGGFFAAAQANPYGHLRKDVTTWVNRLVQRGHMVLFTYEGAEGGEYIGRYNERLYPRCSTRFLVKWLMSLTADKAQQVHAFCARHGRNAK
jgi:hypothetical protein